MINDYSDKVAFVTGAGGGIGRAAAIDFAKRGAKVAVTGRTLKSLETTVKLIEEENGIALAIVTDVLDESSVINALEKTVSEYGKINFAFNNAGIESPPIALADLPTDEWDKLININLRGVFICMKHQIRILLKNSDGGSIINTSSGAGVRGFPSSAGYVASKHGVIGLTKSAALDYADKKIRINAICPGIIETPMMERFTGGTEEGKEDAISQEPVGRMGKPEEISSMVMWLCSEEAKFTTGSAFVVDGGQTI